MNNTPDSEGNGCGRGRGRGHVDWSKPLRRPHQSTITPGKIQEGPTTYADCAEAAGLPGNSEQVTGAGLTVQDPQCESLEKDVLCFMSNFIMEVTNSPGSFEFESEVALRDLNNWATNAAITQKVSMMIVEESITQPNFRYSGARLCSTLIKKCQDMQLDTFWDSLNSELKKEREKATDLLHENPERLRGFLMFLAELFVQLEGETFLCTEICYIIDLLLFNEMPENVKRVCQTLKLAGRYIDSMDTVAMDRIMNKLCKLTNKATCDKSLSCQIMSVAELRRASWGSNVNEAPNQNSEPSVVNVGSDPIFYGPDGSILSAEESKFLEENYEEVGTAGEDDMVIWDYEDPMNGLDDAFEEFLRFSKQQ
ncbi:polyadenylate-binding protein-interacting protein 1 [Schistocerca nitens]|uniref:polyadenylate-binding protein-interacting protein 1 n=1 Tax=Schistocerca nitens TaxID=7011 RepID=UPI00211973CA|nr:polyadenylate-binding protein-interacting protein 1 [Schistocerca nitens]XP_049805511.1 polyadenylate-binding protein-interacting protein 1 [Schistocerca nitens]XP_049805512.1 polyadenylate-binding protein-interacting protein 1 [Schistocerca nitens]